MVAILDAAREGDFFQAKSMYDEAVAAGGDPVGILNTPDRSGRTVAHYAAEYDEVVVFEWIHSHGGDILLRDSQNKTPVDIAILLNAKLLKKKKPGSDVLVYIKSRALTPIQQMFYLDNGESASAIPDSSSLDQLPDASLSEQYPYYNYLSAAHVFALTGRMDLLNYLHTRNISSASVDDDGNTPLHFVSSPEMVEFLVKHCKVNAQNSSDGFTAAHSVVSRVYDEELTEDEAVCILKALIGAGADLKVKCESYGMTVPQLVVELVGEGILLETCDTCPGALDGLSIAEFVSLHQHIDPSDSESLSVASHDDKVVREDGSSENDDEEEGLDEIIEEDEDFVIKPRK
jgi:ankyrin repeat protein